MGSTHEKYCVETRGGIQWVLAKRMKEDMSSQKEMVSGTWYAILAFGIWGVLPIYWKLFKTVSPFEIVAHRIIWTCLLTGIILLLKGKWANLVQVFRQGKKMRGIIFCALLLSFNWVVFIYAVNSGHVLDTSLGYYINPLISCIGVKKIIIDITIDYGDLKI